MSRPEWAIARVLKADGQPAGLAFAVGRQRLVTCAHVVNVALGRGTREVTDPGQGPLPLQFPFARTDDEGRGTASIVRWLPPQGPFDRYDVAALALDADLPDGVQPLRLAGTQRIGEVHMWGPFRQRARATEGVGVRGTLMPSVDRNRLQVNQELSGIFRVDHGFSGGPVWQPDTNLVVGMLQAASTDDGATDAYVIGTDLLATILDASEIDVGEAAPAYMRLDHATVHYNRPDGDYAGWALHVWGGGLAPGVFRVWHQPRQPDGGDAFGLYWHIPLVDPTKPVEFIIHRGDVKDPGPDMPFTPAEQPHAYVRSGESQVYHSPQERLPVPLHTRTATVHYHRPDGDYAGWALHVWGGGLAPGVFQDWHDPHQPDGADAFGLYWHIELLDVTKLVEFIVHRGDDKDPGNDQPFIPAQHLHAYVVSGRPEVYRSPVI